MASATENPQTAGTAQEQKEVHVGVKCEGCGMDPIVGEWYRCMSNKCKSGYDNFCERCKTSGVTPGNHKADHRMKKVCSRSTCLQY